ncbi:MAG TPA: DUF2378 family protein [Myxococcaceae bacterium]|nr:DUF2378 family protein [Myxococcaceae bacterium]
MSDVPPPDVVFRNTVEALFLKALGSKLTMRCVERVKEAGIDLRSKKLKLFYPRETYYRCVRIVGEELFGELEEDQRMMRLGHAFMDGYEQTVIGKAMITAVRFMGPKRTLAKMTTNFRSSNNYMQTELREEKPGDVSLTLSQTSGAPGYFEAVLTRAMGFAGAKGFGIRREAYDGARCTYRITWAP